MSSNKANINEFYCELNHYYQSVVIPFNIEYIMLFTNVIHAIKDLFYVSKASPFASFDYGSPFLQCDFCIRMGFCIFFYSLFCKNSHLYYSVIVCKYINKIPFFKI